MYTIKSLQEIGSLVVSEMACTKMLKEMPFAMCYIGFSLTFYLTAFLLLQMIFEMTGTIWKRKIKTRLKA